MIPKKLPNAELKIAAASFPPTALVKITAEETGGGIQLTVISLEQDNIIFFNFNSNEDFKLFSRHQNQ
jgi:hypothetical protein